jgi:hypothetical protein
MSLMNQLALSQVGVGFHPYRNLQLGRLKPLAVTPDP